MPPAPWTVLLALVAVLLTAAGAVDSNAAAPAQRVFIIAGGTGSRAVYSVLEAAGVWMHPDTDAALNSRPYQQQALVPLTLGLPVNHSCRNQTTPDWAADPLAHSFYNRVVPANMSAAAAASHIKMASRMLGAVPSTATAWGWKHQHALYTLPFVYQAFPQAHVIHQVQDGRDFALSNLQRREGGGSRTRNVFVRHFVHLLLGRSFTPTETASLHFSQALGQLWALTNSRALAWAGHRATAMRGAYSVVRVEDLCNPVHMRGAIRTMLSNAQLPHDDGVVGRAAAALSAGGCHTGSQWQTAWESRKHKLSAAVRAIDLNLSAALEAFDYRPRLPLKLPEWLEAAPIMSQLVAVAQTVAGPRNQTIILTFVTDEYERVVGNWLAWAQQSGADMSRVLIVSRPNCLDAVKAAARGTGATVFSLPPLSSHVAAGLNENGIPGFQVYLTRGAVWLERVRAVYELNRHGLSVLQTDLDAIWLKNPLPYVLKAAHDQPQGYDLVLSKGRTRSEAYTRHHIAAGCMGFAFYNATAGAQSTLRHLLREKLRHLSLNVISYYNDQNILNEAMERANLAYNASQGPAAVTQPSTSVSAWKVTTAPAPLRIFFVPESIVQRSKCKDRAIRAETWIAHCDTAKSGRGKEADLKQLKLWKQPQQPQLVALPS